MESESASLNENQQDNMDYTFRNPGMAMATASLLLGILSFFMIMSVIVPFICGGLAILFALLSKGYGKKMLTQAKFGLWCGVGSIAVTVGILISTVSLLLANPDMLIQIGQQYDTLMEENYGTSAEEIYGMSFEDMMKQYADMMQ